MIAELDTVRLVEPQYVATINEVFIIIHRVVDELFDGILADPNEVLSKFGKLKQVVSASLVNPEVFSKAVKFDITVASYSRLRLFKPASTTFRFEPLRFIGNDWSRW